MRQTAASILGSITVMPIAFSTSLRSLAAEQDRGRIAGLALALVLVAAWASWLFGAELVLVEVSDRARPEVHEAAVPVTTMLAGRVREARLGLGRRVAAGEVLVVLEDQPLQLERRALLAALTGLRAQLAASEREQAALVVAIETSRLGGRARASEAQAEHQLRAPIAGTLGHAPPLHPGAVLAQHATVAQIVPDGELRIVASFHAAAIGRIVPGLPVRLRLDGFPWAEFGSLRGEVLRVASESVGGLIRVECSIDPASAPLIPREHGLGGALEIEVERISPFALVTRDLALALGATAPVLEPEAGQAE